jgi:hypothetical protein
MGLMLHRCNLDEAMALLLKNQFDQAHSPCPILTLSLTTSPTVKILPHHHPMPMSNINGIHHSLSKPKGHESARNDSKHDRKKMLVKLHHSSYQGRD